MSSLYILSKFKMQSFINAYEYGLSFPNPPTEAVTTTRGCIIFIPLFLCA
nr:MAG TPA: hypothetical protein [Bacteriophage sp.]